jgi:hypothetical protein
MSAIENATLFRVFLNDGTAVVSYGEFARRRPRGVRCQSVRETLSSTAPNLHVVNIPATAVDWPATTSLRRVCAVRAPGDEMPRVTTRLDGEAAAEFDCVHEEPAGAVEPGEGGQAPGGVAA